MILWWTNSSGECTPVLEWLNQWQWWYGTPFKAQVILNPFAWVWSGRSTPSLSLSFFSLSIIYFLILCVEQLPIVEPPFTMPHSLHPHPLNLVLFPLTRGSIISHLFIPLTPIPTKHFISSTFISHLTLTLHFPLAFSWTINHLTLGLSHSLSTLTQPNLNMRKSNI